MAVDGEETWNVQNYSYPEETGLDHLDPDWVIRSILGVGADFEYELLSSGKWIARRLVANKFRDRRVFICGDAAHVWMPLGGFGMSAGIADAANLAWKLAGVLHGWAAPAILDAYEAERHPITEQASRIISDIGRQRMIQREELSPELEQLDASGEAARAATGQRSYPLDLEQQCCGGLNFGYFYDRSPIIAYDGEPPAIPWAHSLRARCQAAARRISGWKESACSTTRWGRITHCCALIPRRLLLAF